MAAPTSGFYRIEYTEAQFEQDERDTADLFVRARTASGGFTGESAIRFNAGEDERIDLVLTATSTLPPEEVDLSELEELQANPRTRSGKYRLRRLHRRRHSIPHPRTDASPRL